MEKTTEDEINSFFDRLRAAQRDGRPWGLLKKEEKATENISALEKEAARSIGALGQRAIYHADRLLEEGRSEPERNFAQALANNAKDLMEIIEDRYKVREIVSGESSDCCLWWTLSPYIFDELKSRVGEKEALRLILEWSKTGKHEVADEKVNLTGLDFYNCQRLHPNLTFTLSQNPNGASHQFARQEAQRLVREVFVG